MVNSDFYYTVCDFIYRKELKKFDIIKQKILVNTATLLCELIHLLCELFHLSVKQNIQERVPEE